MAKRYDLYGIGNALVDIEVEVAPEFLSKMNIEKGLMTLVDHARQDQIFQEITGNPHKRSCGGSAANTCIGLSQLGGRGFYSCKTAKDEMGDFYTKDLIGSGLSTNLAKQERKDGVTGRCLVMITPDADRTMNTYLGITETFSVEELVEEELKASEYLYIEGYLVTSETGRAAAIQARKWAKEADVKVALTFSDPGIVAHFKEGFDEIMGKEKVDLLFCNEGEAMAYTKTSSTQEAFAALKGVATAFAITRGHKGALIYDGQKEIDVLTSKVEAVDTNGAGDLFAGAFIYGLTNGYSYAEAGRLACACASELVTRFGARLTKDRILKVKSEVLNGDAK